MRVKPECDLKHVSYAVRDQQGTSVKSVVVEYAKSALTPKRGFAQTVTRIVNRRLKG